METNSNRTKTTTFLNFLGFKYYNTRHAEFKDWYNDGRSYWIRFPEDGSIDKKFGMGSIKSCEILQPKDYHHNWGFYIRILNKLVVEYYYHEIFDRHTNELKDILFSDYLTLNTSRETNMDVICNGVLIQKQTHILTNYEFANRINNIKLDEFRDLLYHIISNLNK